MKILLELFFVCFEIGAFTFGGGYAMIPMIQYQVCSREWMSVEQLVDFIAVAESTPGPVAVNVSTYVGSVMGGFTGAVFATFGIILPSFIIILFVAKMFSKFKNNRYVEGAMSGLKPAVVGMIAASVITIGQTVFFPNGMTIEPAFFVSLLIFVPALILAVKKKHPILIIILSGTAGIIAGMVGLI